MEDRLRFPARAAPALAALLGILVVTAAWWALALWPLPGDAPAWLARTREICFGSLPTGLPHAGGWLVLVGEPVGLVVFLLAAWGGEVREGLIALWRYWLGRGAVVAVAALIVLGAIAATARVANASGERFALNDDADPAAVIVPVGEASPGLDLVSQHGDTVTLARLRGRPAVVAFVFAHCTTVCPLIVRDVVAAAGDGATAVFITLDPWRDTPSRLPSMARDWRLPSNALVLSGAVEDVEFALNRWKVPRVRNQVTGDVIHPAVAYVLDADGFLRYQTNGTRAAVTEALERLGSMGT
jgi:protein SCO1/2